MLIKLTPDVYSFIIFDPLKLGIGFKEIREIIS